MKDGRTVSNHKEFDHNYAHFIQPEEMEKLISLLNEQDILTLKNTKNTGVPDQANPEIILTNSTGNEHRVYNPGSSCFWR